MYHLDREGIHVCTQGNTWGFASAEGGNNAMLCKWVLVGDAQCIQLMPGRKQTIDSNLWLCISFAVHWHTKPLGCKCFYSVLATGAETDKRPLSPEKLACFGFCVLQLRYFVQLSVYAPQL